jgi:hypothetical protein
MRYFSGAEGIRFVYFNFFGVTMFISSFSANSDFTDDSFTLKSSKGLCAFEDDSLKCGSQVSKPSEFTVCLGPQDAAL